MERPNLREGEQGKGKWEGRGREKRSGRGSCRERGGNLEEGREGNKSYMLISGRESGQGG